MSKQFDVTTKHLIETQPRDWLHYAGINVNEVEVIDADVSSVTASVDKVLRINEAKPWLTHFEF